MLIMQRYVFATHCNFSSLILNCWLRQWQCQRRTILSAMHTKSCYILHFMLQNKGISYFVQGDKVGAHSTSKTMFVLVVKYSIIRIALFFPYIVLISNPLSSSYLFKNNGLPLICFPISIFIFLHQRKWIWLFFYYSTRARALSVSISYPMISCFFLVLLLLLRTS